MTYAEKLQALRLEMQKSALDGYLIPRSDEYQNEFVPASAERLFYLTGFSGSAGYAIVLKDRAAVFSDGRYTIQLSQQLDPQLYETGDSTKIFLGDWLAANAGSGTRIGYDPRIHTSRAIQSVRDKLAGRQIELIPIETNLVDAIWTDRPSPPLDLVEIFPEEIAGRSSSEKRMAIAQSVQDEGCQSVILTLPDSIAWLLNIRGQDVAHNPVALSYAILHAADASLDWFVEEEKLTPEILRHIGNNIRVFRPQELAVQMEKLAGPVMLDPQRSSEWFLEKLKKSCIETRAAKDPCILPKAIKTAGEQAAMAHAHIRDGVAVTKFLYWLENNAQGQTEVSIAEKLEEFRRADPLYRDSSFETICGWAANGAIVHYRAEADTAAVISGSGLLLVDSGGQYADGTTDITRTVAIGTATAEMKDCFTRVLKGHIALARAQFPKSTTGAQLDTLARQPLWEVGLDYAHGTGHGVGCYLSVHEEAASISPRGNDQVLPGMIISNEPGYYKQGAFGIRIENLILCLEAGKRAEDGRDILNFATLTLAPIDRSLMIETLLSDAEREWLNAYHARVFEEISPFLTGDEQNWLRAQTAAI